MDEFKLSIYKILEAYRMLYSSMSGVRKFLGSFRYDYNNLLWDTIAELESQIVTEEKNRRAVGFSKIQKRTPRAKKIDSYINSQYDKQNVIACLKSFIKGHKGKQVAIVLCAAYRAGLTTVERIPYALLVCREETDGHPVDSGRPKHLRRKGIGRKRLCLSLHWAVTLYGMRNNNKRERSKEGMNRLAKLPRSLEIPREVADNFPELPIHCLFDEGRTPV